MVGSYIRAVTSRASRQAWRAVIAHSWRDLIWKLLVGAVALAVLIAFVWITPADDDAFLTDKIAFGVVGFATIAILVFGVFVAQLLFVAPYQLWKEQKERADRAEASVCPEPDQQEKRFKEAILAVQHLATARELWWQHWHSKPRDQELPNRLAEAINNVRGCFPPDEAPSDPNNDPITRLWSAASNFGTYLGLSRDETPRLTEARREFEQALAATNDRFELLMPSRTNDALLALKRAAKAAIKRLRERLEYVDRVIESKDREELRKWQRKTASQLMFQVDRLASIDANDLPESQADRLEYTLHLIADFNESALMISRGEGYTRLSQAAGMYRGRAEKLFAALSEISGTNPDWKAQNEG